MANVFVKNIAVPKTFRNKRIYGGNSFASTNIFEQGETGGAQKHVEAGVVTDLGYSNFVFFTEEFNDSPILVQFKLFKMVELQADFFVIQDVLFYHAFNPFYSEAGFVFSIDSSEDLTGVELHYYFTE